MGPSLELGSHILNESVCGLDEDVKCSLLGNSFSVPAVDFLLGRGLASAGILAEPPTIAECWGAPGPGGEDCLEMLLGAAAGEATPDQVHRALCEALVRNAVFKGSDVRTAAGGLPHPSGWPRRGVDADRWLWKT